jgi:shikimate dehydrogenase
MPDIFDFETSTDEYAVMGNPVAHSKSPLIHSAFARQTGQRIHYSAIQVDPGGFPQAVGNFFANGGKGLNVTVPFKQEAWQLADSLSDRAELAGAVNTLLMQNERLFGDNTDGVGLLRDLNNNLKIKLKDKRMLIIGAGGAARGVLQPLIHAKPRTLVIANRTPDKARELAGVFTTYAGDRYAANIQGCGFDDLDGQQYDIVINATSASLKGDLPPIPKDVFAEGALCYDMMYGAEPTIFLQWAQQCGVIQLSDGLGMLVEQAAISFHLWRGVLPETAPVIRQIRDSLK